MNLGDTITEYNVRRLQTGDVLYSSNRCQNIIIFAITGINSSDPEDESKCHICYMTEDEYFDKGIVNLLDEFVVNDTYRYLYNACNDIAQSISRFRLNEKLVYELVEKED